MTVTRPLPQFFESAGEQMLPTSHLRRTGQLAHPSGTKLARIATVSA